MSWGAIRIEGMAKWTFTVLCTQTSCYSKSCSISPKDHAAAAADVGMVGLATPSANESTVDGVDRHSACLQGVDS